LPNRTAFNDRLNLAMARARPDAPCAVLLLDLDHFQNVNDTLGHEQGDLLLVSPSPAASVRACRRQAFMARFSGDEFVILLENMTVEQAKQDGAGDTAGPGP
jgi:diguanylate cyclase